MPTLKADVETCQGYGNCIASAPDAFDMDDDGKVVLLRISVTEDELPRIEGAARACPVNALSIEH